jgi:hypothetical protein
LITALISTITGLISGTVPDLLKEWSDSREHDREMFRLEKQTELQLLIAEKNGQMKVAEMASQESMAAYEAYEGIAKASLKSSGVRWSDAWNSALRPFAVTIIMVLYAVIASYYAFSVLSVVDTLEDTKTAVVLLWGSLIGESIQAVLGFLFGYRSSKR